MKKLLKHIALISFMLGYITVNGQNEIALFSSKIDQPNCVEKIMKNIPFEKGVKNIEVSLQYKSVLIEFKKDKTTPQKLELALKKLGYESNYLGEPISFGVKGNCGMCKENIEKAAHSIEGVTAAFWDKEKKIITVTFDATQTNIDAIHKAIADVGYDTEKVRAEDAAYNNLHSCCKYER